MDIISVCQVLITMSCSITRGTRYTVHGQVERHPEYRSISAFVDTVSAGLKKVAAEARGLEHVAVGLCVELPPPPVPSRQVPDSTLCTYSYTFS
jgi:hypothetical protein